MFWFSSCLIRMHSKYHGCWYEISILNPNIYIPGELVSLPCLLGQFRYQPAHRKECPARDPEGSGPLREVA